LYYRRPLLALQAVIQLTSALVQSIRIPVLLSIPAFVSCNGALRPAKVF